MIFFLIKKTFFDMWDNLFRIFLLNLIFIIILLACGSLMFLAQNLIGSYSLIFVVLGLVLLSIYSGVVSLYVREIADYKKPEFLELFSYLKKSWLTSLIFFAITVIFIFLARTAILYYSTIHNPAGYLLFGLIVWLAFSFILSIQYFFPIYSRMKNNPIKTLKKCFLVFIDNPLFTLVLLIGSIIIMILSFITFFLIPGIAGLLLWLNAAFKLRLYKYDYLELHPEAKNKRIPWKEILADEKECVGKRTLRNLIFPWKD